MKGGVNMEFTIDLGFVAAAIEARNKVIRDANTAIDAVNQATARVNNVGAEMQEQVVRPMVRGGIIPGNNVK